MFSEHTPPGYLEGMAAPLWAALPLVLALSLWQAPATLGLALGAP